VLGGDGSVPVEDGRFGTVLGVGVEQGVVGHDQVDGDGHVGCGCLSGEAFDEGVGHDLSPPAFVPGRGGRVGGLGEAGVGGHTLGDREQRGQIHHGFGCGA
jgi:hypothetical protein